MKKVLTTTEFVFWLHDDRIGNRKGWEVFVTAKQYAEVMRLPLEPGMFVPCVDGKPLGLPPTHRHQGKIEYQQAKERVLFHGVEYIRGYLESEQYLKQDIETWATWNYILSKWQWIEHCRIIEDLARQVDLKPTKAFLEKIGL